MYNDAEKCPEEPEITFQNAGAPKLVAILFRRTEIWPWKQPTSISVCISHAANAIRTWYEPCWKPDRSQRMELAWTGGLASTIHRSVTLDDSTMIKWLKPPNVTTGASTATDKPAAWRSIGALGTTVCNSMYQLNRVLELTRGQSTPHHQHGQRTCELYTAARCNGNLEILLVHYAITKLLLLNLIRVIA